MKKSISVSIVNAFVTAQGGGNPAGVVLNADRFNQEEKQRIAAKVGLSETAFVSQSKIADVKLEFFTPTRQIPHCGHATIAAFSYLVQTGSIRGARSSKETIDGTRQIILEGDMAFMEQTPPHFSSLSLQSNLSVSDVLDSVGMSESKLIAEKTPSIVNTGNSFLIIPVATETILSNLRPNVAAIKKISNDLDLIGFYPFTLETREKGHHAQARMFAPRYGIAEESATGMAAGPLGCYLAERLGMTHDELLIEQGYLMTPPSPSLITVRLERKKRTIVGLMVGGTASVSSTREVAL